MADKIDKFFRDKLRKEQVPFDPALWEEAAALLDQKDKKKRLLWWLIPAGALVGLLLGFFWFFQQDGGHHLKDSNKEAVANIVRGSDKTGADTSSFSKEEPESTIPKDNAQNSFELGRSNGPTTKSASFSNENLSKAGWEKSNAKSGSETNNINKSNFHLFNDAATESKDITGTQEEGPSQTTFIQEISNGKVFEKESLHTKVPEFIDFLPASFLEKPISAKAPKPADISIRIPGERGWAAGVELATHGLAGTGGNTFLSPELGGWTGFDFSLNWGIRLGLAYQYISGELDRSETTTRVSYSFGSENSQQQLRVTGAHFLTLPVWVHRNIRDHQLQIGLKPMYLLALTGKKETRYYPNGGSLASVESQTGTIPDARKGFPWNLGILLRYAYPLQRFKVGVSGQYYTRPLLEAADDNAKPLQPYSLGLFVQYRLK